MNVLSLFDGMSCGQIALNRAGIPYEKYYASEIDKHAIKVATHNYPDTVELGDINNWRQWPIDWAQIDLILAGSPCQGFSFAGKQLAFDDPRSALFFVFVDILNHIKSLNPNVKFLLENVRMKKEYLAVISQKLGVEPVMINSALVSAQNRVRFYWANWNIEQPEDKSIFLKDIIEDGVVDREKSYCLTSTYSHAVPRDYFEKNSRQIVFGGAMRGRYLENGVRQDHKMLTAGLTKQQIELREDRKTNTLTSVQKDNLVVKVGIVQKAQGNNKCGCHYEKSPTLTSNSLQDNNHLILAGVANLKGNDSIKRIYSSSGKAPTLTAVQGGHQEPKIQVNGVGHREGKDKDGNVIYWRKLTPIECERLQTVPDNYTAIVSNNQRYKMLGNGWTVDVIAHIFNGLLNEKNTLEWATIENT